MNHQKKKDIDPNRKVYIYSLKNPLTNKVKYIGWTFQIKRRLSNHIYEAGHPEKTICPLSAKNMWIRSLLEDNIRPAIEIIEENIYINHEDREKYWISFYGRENLVNGTDGGDFSGFIKTGKDNSNNYYLKRMKLFFLFKKLCIKALRDYTFTKYGCEVEEADKSLGFVYNKELEKDWGILDHISGKFVTLGEYLVELKNQRNPFIEMDHDTIDEFWFWYETCGTLSDPDEPI